jgi:hypothetical protein
VQRTRSHAGLSSTRSTILATLNEGEGKNGHDLPLGDEVKGAPMEFSPREFAEPAVDLRYSPNKMHGDEIEAAGDGLTLRERDPVEWLERGEIEALIRAKPAIGLLLVDDTAGYPPKVYRVPGHPMSAWHGRLSKLYISDDGYVDPVIGWSLMAYRWQAADGSDVLVFRFEC